jgi:hypothetical protein
MLLKEEKYKNWINHKLGKTTFQNGRTDLILHKQYNAQTEYEVK